MVMVFPSRPQQFGLVPRIAVVTAREDFSRKRRHLLDAAKE
jgi:hypothetical protein